MSRTPARYYITVTDWSGAETFNVNFDERELIVTSAQIARPFMIIADEVHRIFFRVVRIEYREVKQLSDHIPEATAVIRLYRPKDS